MITTSTPRKVLFFTNSEYGQANIVLSVAHELSLRPNVEVHIASFPVLSPRIKDLQDRIRVTGSPARVFFHPLRGISLKEARIRRIGTNTPTHAPSLSGALRSFRRLPYYVAEWSGPEYMELYDSCVEIIQDLNAHAIVIEYFLSQAIDACRFLNLKFIIMTPNAPKDIIGRIQPYGSIFWKYPVMSSGIPYPMSWYHIPKNAFLTCAMVYFMFSSPKIQELVQYRQKLGLNNTIPMFEPYMADAHYLCPATPKTDFPCAIPDNVTLCGPILVPAVPVEEEDPELASWLDSGPTMLVNLGTHAVFDEDNTCQIATALHILLGHDRYVQVIWKLKVHDDVQTSLRDILGIYMEKGRVRIVDWLDVEPLAILRHPNLICTVNHGGANSVYEGIHTGIPQVVLPMWYDCYDYAARIEWLGIGIYGNKKSAPRVEASELSRALIKVIGGGDEAARFRAAAKSLAEDTRNYSGQVMACDKIMELARTM
ncbi:UDP-Glycosyltransferase/glycogen phosphorylase [Armillaria solidipes]|uniref:UDP-Glycosyltransferase/glycogen phosphorylase n=1 Tax=Armillaria solidipes TaxID=1076256 RepID=A0A2H3BCS0_9AGAR|nr:UDP-Glycosyltransferase/glycogen phosphorylase [Armillaria solidipes]